LEKFWWLLDFDTPAQAREAVLDFVPKLVSVYGDVAGAAALQWYEELRAKASRKLPEYTPTISPGVPEEDIRSVVRAHAGAFWEGDPWGALEAVKKGVDTWVKYSGRDTIARNVKLDPAKPRFARVPSGKTCAFCSMLASRGWVYHSEETAGAVSKFHAHCDCQIVPSWEHKDAHVRGFDPDADYERYRAARAQVKSEGEDPNDINQVAARARLMFPSYYKDGIGEGGRSSGSGRGRTLGAVDKGGRRLKLRRVRDGRMGDGTVSLSQWDSYCNQVIERWNADSALRKSGAAVPPRDPAQLPAAWRKREDILLNDLTYNHVLYGSKGPGREAPKGGHFSGYGWVHSCPEFPPSWSPDEVLKALDHVLISAWDQEGTGKFFATYRDVEVEVFIVKRKSGFRIASFYPKTR
jgi:hypothetical protein